MLLLRYKKKSVDFKIRPKLSVLDYIHQDWVANKGNIKAQLILAFFRISYFLYTSNGLLFYLGIPVLILYRIVVEWFLCVEIPFRTKIGKSIKLYHGQGLVLNNNVIIGDNCILRHSTTIGTSRMAKDGTFCGCPVIGNNVDIGANVVIIGPIVIGNNVTIGAGSVVVKSIEANSTVVGNPARIIAKSTIIA
jgi:putative colanic acid biosynthesis acetyltransferase WcaB